jgi:hypothetical protein
MPMSRRGVRFKEVILLWKLKDDFVRRRQCRLFRVLLQGLSDIWAHTLVMLNRFLSTSGCGLCLYDTFREIIV